MAEERPQPHNPLEILEDRIIEEVVGKGFTKLEKEDAEGFLIGEVVSVAAGILSTYGLAELRKNHKRAMNTVEKTESTYLKAKDSPSSVTDKVYTTQAEWDSQAPLEVNSTQSGHLAISYAGEVQQEIVNQKQEQVIVLARQIVEKADEKPEIRAKINDLATDQWHLIADEELIETSSNAKKTPLDHAREILKAQGYLTPEQSKALLNVVSGHSNFSLLSNLLGRFPAEKVLGEAIKSITRSGKNAQEVTLEILREHFSKYIQGASINPKVIEDGIENVARGLGITIPDNMDRSFLAQAVASDVLLHNARLLERGSDRQDLKELFTVAEVVGVLDDVLTPTASTRR